jgi:hypothetical protein
VQELCHLIPNFQKKIDEAEPEELSEYYSQVCFTISMAFSSKQRSQLQTGANNARSDDLNRIRDYVADWLNQSQLQPSPPLAKDKRNNRGISHDVTGRLLCPAEFDWDDLEYVSISHCFSIASDLMVD